MEIEAKFDLARVQDWDFWSQRLGQQAPLEGWYSEPAQEPLTLAAFYYDTLQADVYQAGFSLRLRREGQRLLYTVKRALASDEPQAPPGEPDQAGIFRRQEWEEVLTSQVAEDFQPQDYAYKAWERIQELSKTDRTLAPLGEILAREQLILQGSTRFTRYRGDLVKGKTRVEWALDRGYFQHPDLREDFAELEFELKSGQSRDLQALLDQLQKLRPLRVQAWSKQVRALHRPYDLIILGAGPAGLAAGLGAGLKAQDAAYPARILILDKETQAGRKILASGNGRCNLSNRNPASDKYLSHASPGKDVWLDQLGHKFTSKFFHQLGLAFKYDAEGRAYPQSEEARSVRDLLLARLEALKIEFRFETDIRQISPATGPGQSFYLQSSQGQLFRSKALIFAPGSPASPALGGNWSMAQLAQAWDLPYQDFRPALCGLLLDPHTSLSQLTGCRVKAQARLSGGQTSQGEFLFNKGALSGIAAMDLANYLGGEPGHFRDQDPQAAWLFTQAQTVHLDLFPAQEGASLAKDLAAKGRAFAWELSWDLLLASYLPAKLGRAILQEAGLDYRGPAQAKVARSLAYRLKAYPVKLVGLKAFAEAQVARGGLELGALNPDYSLKGYPGAYVCGEALDVVGFCGGFNLHFAWASGYKAGQTAVTRLIGSKTRK
ncbi:MAG: aminoacetone oxidase family FAD-binding enzyme [Eubacteriales bacterium]|nr:aminoacetone oxidase family FAD-binding enzyme [Eubacteriales bacterium]